MIRVLVVDDSPTTRQAIVAMLETDPEIQVIGQACDGLEAVALAAGLKPDVITMDIHMPNMDGYDATRQIMRMNPTPIVVVTSVSQQELVHRGLDILLAGALEIVQKPSGLNGSGMQVIRSELVTKVRAVAQVRVRASSQ
ncbi:MAG: response regulator [Chloroflexi bacterium]|nr:response regulator [Chloroflexota bacterium]